MYKKVEAEIGGRILSIETGKIAKQAHGSVIVTYGGTVVLVTAVAAREARASVDFLPLTVEYQERFYAVGRIPGSFFRREIGRPTEKETLTARFIDRPLRPLFAEGYQHETQVVATVLSADKENDPDMLAMVGASAALTLSHIPFLGPIGGVRVGFIDNEYVLNPTVEQLAESRMEIVVAGSKDGIVMVEGGVETCSEQEVLEALYFGLDGLQPLLAMQAELQEATGKTKMEVTPPEVNEDLVQQVGELAREDMAKVVATADKMERSEKFHQLTSQVLEKLI